jgi:hypothetical protein
MHASAISGALYQNLAFSSLKAVFEGLVEGVRVEAVGTIVNILGSVYALVVAGGAVGLVASLALKREKLFMEMVAGG